MVSSCAARSGSSPGSASSCCPPAAPRPTRSALFGIEELLARINATLRRSKPTADGRPEPSVVRIGDVEIDLERRRVTKAGGLVHLTPTEFALLRQFAVSPGELLTHATLLRRVWGPGYETQTEYTRVYVGRLRAKLERDGDEPLFITEPRSGYRFATA
jgi:two-component system KDP operon response regulator KdpE